VTRAARSLFIFSLYIVATCLAFATGAALLVAFAHMPPTVLLLGATDVAGAIWTALALASHCGVMTHAAGTPSDRHIRSQ